MASQLISTKGGCLSLIGALFFFACGRGQTENGRGVRPFGFGVAAADDGAMGNSPIHSHIGWGLTTIEYVISDQAPDQVVEASILAAEIWNEALGFEKLVCRGKASLPEDSSLHQVLEDDVVAVYYDLHWQKNTEKNAETMGISVWKDADGSDQIVKADVILNAETYSFLDLTRSIPAQYTDRKVVDAQTVLLHELGHVLGLNHVPEVDDPESVMHARTYTVGRNTFRSLSSKDLEHLKEIYP